MAFANCETFSAARLWVVGAAGWPPLRWLRRIPPWLLLGIALAPVWIWYVRRMNDGDDEPLGLVVLLGAAWLAWRERRELCAGSGERFAGALLVLGSVLAIGWLPPLVRAGVGVCGMVCWCGAGRRAGLLGLFVLSLPVVASLQFYLGYPMRMASAAGAEWLLDSAGLVVSRHGANLELGGQTVGVDPACGGVRMLWHAWVAVMALAAFHRVTWRVAVLGAALVPPAVAVANAVRSAWLAMVETGRMSDAGLGHGGVGLVIFAVMVLPFAWFMGSRARQAVIAGAPAPPRYSERIVLLAAALLAPLPHGPMSVPPSPAPASPPPVEFTFNGLTLPLEPLPPTPQERAFAASFSGELGGFRWGEAQVILRRVTTATRRLHPSSDCLKAAGYRLGDAIVVRATDGTEWSRFTASGDGRELLVHERIVSECDGSTWTDVPAWFWSALRHPLNGPWRAETVIESRP